MGSTQGRVQGPRSVLYHVLIAVYIIDEHGFLQGPAAPGLSQAVRA